MFKKYYIILHCSKMCLLYICINNIYIYIILCKIDIAMMTFSFFNSKKSLISYRVRVDSLNYVWNIHLVYFVRVIHNENQYTNIVMYTVAQIWLLYLKFTRTMTVRKLHGMAMDKQRQYIRLYTVQLKS
jgi:hypothetical protein